MPKHRKIKLQLSTEVDVPSAATDDNAPRQFSGVAHSGLPFAYWDMMAVVDLSTVSSHERLPVLMLHDRDKRAGWGELAIATQMEINGQLLNNQHGKEVASDADAGFPWQLSAHLESDTVDELAHGETATVNGQTVTGPMLILRNSACYEVSFTPTGVDTNTYAMVLSDSGADDPKPNPQSDTKPTQSTGDDMTLEEALEQIKALEEQVEKQAEDLVALEEKLKAAQDAEKAATVDAQLSAAGFTKTDGGKGYGGISDSTYKMLLSADDASARALISDLPKPQQQNQTPPPSWLTGEQHGSGQSADVQLSNNPLLADAANRGNSNGKHYI